MESLFLAQCFDAVRAPAWIEFTFFHTIARRKPNEGRAEQSTADAQTEKEQKLAQGMPEELRGFFVIYHSLSTFLRTALRHRFDFQIVFFFDLVHAAVRFGKKRLSRGAVRGEEGTTYADGDNHFRARGAARLLNGPR